MDTKQNRRMRYTSLKEWRIVKDFSQREAAEHFDIAPSYWSMLETGTRHPHARLAKRLSVETGVPVEKLLGIAS